MIRMQETKKRTAEDSIAFLKIYGEIVGLIVGGAASQLWIWGFDKLKNRQEKKKRITRRAKKSSNARMGRILSLIY